MVNTYALAERHCCAGFLRTGHGRALRKAREAMLVSAAEYLAQPIGNELHNARRCDGGSGGRAAPALAETPRRTLGRVTAPNLKPGATSGTEHVA